jgi:glucan biosynthesis protein
VATTDFGEIRPAMEPVATKVPPELLRLSYDQHQKIQFDYRQSWWQNDKLWAGLLVVCTLGMCWFFR